MYIWKVRLEEHWDYEEDGEWSVFDDVTVAAKDYETAMAKATKVRLGASFIEDGITPPVKRKCVAVRLVSIERGEWLDA